MKESKQKLIFFLFLVGLWQIAGPFLLIYDSFEMKANSIITGLLVLLFSSFALKVEKIWPRLVLCALGLWLEFSPLGFWAPSPVSFFNDTFTGFAVLALTLHLFVLEERPVDASISDIPPGWSFNPSTWLQRNLTIFLAVVCWSLSTYMGTYQLGYIHTMWDPFFGDGTLKVITSKISHSFPISDAGFGAFCYTLDAVMGWQGSKRRWHTMPWTVIFFGLLVVPVGFVTILLIILQPVAVGAWCGLCLITAASMLLMIVFTVAEVVASIQFLQRCKAEGKPILPIFWRGGDYPKEKKAPVNLFPKALIRGVTIPWNLVLSIILGFWLLCSIPYLKLTGLLADSNYVTGPLLIAISVISLAEAIRTARYFNLILGIWLVISPFLLGGYSTPALLNNILIGLLALLLAFPRGKIREQYGSWNPR